MKKLIPLLLIAAMLTGGNFTTLAQTDVIEDYKPFFIEEYKFLAKRL
ncbi:MAG: hypothetical protein WD052_14110 [Bacteroidales bacterium]